MKASAYTLGCKVNQYDTNAMMELLVEEGFERVEWGEPADVYIINTCTVTNTADKKSRNAVKRAVRMNPGAVVCVCGCLPQSASCEMMGIDGVSAVIGTKDRLNIGKIVRACMEGQRVNAVEDISSPAAFEGLSVSSSGEMTRGYVKIQEGCNNFCSYCIIPYVRGRERSRDADDVEKEAERLAERGVKEIVLTGIHISSYGGKGGLIELTERISEIDGIERIRIGSIEPDILTDSFAKGLSKIRKVCPHFHVPLQSGSGKILKLMNRKYTPDEYYEFIGNIRRHYDAPAITTDIITGFPGEKAEEFEETLRFAEKIGFARMHVFPYSERSGTPAAEMPERVSVSERRARAAELIKLGKHMEHSYMEIFSGRVQDVLFETVEQGIAAGYTSRYIRVNAVGARPGTICGVLLDSRKGDIMTGRLQ